MRSNLLPFGIILSNSRRPGSLWADAFRGHGLSLLAPARGMPTLPAKGGFSRPSLGYPAGSSDTCYSRRSRRPPLTRTGKAIYGTILYHFIQLKNCVIGKCYTSSPYTCPFIGVCRRWAQSPPLVGLPC